MPETLPYFAIPPVSTSKTPPESILIIHGAFCCAASHIDLAMALRSLGYCPILYSRRGRLNSPPHPDDYSMATEVDDALNILKETGARLVFGLSSGALISLCLARHLATLDDKSIKLKALAVFEPPFYDKDVYEEADSNVETDKSRKAKKKSLGKKGTSKKFALERQYRQQIAAHNEPGAMTTAMLIVEMGPPLAEYLPQRVWAWIISWAMKLEERKRLIEATQANESAKDGKKVKSRKDKTNKIDGVDMTELQKTPTLREYAPTIDYDFRLVRELAGEVHTFAVLKDTPVLLMNGTKSPKFIIRNLPELVKAMPKCEHKVFEGEHHGMPMQKAYDGHPQIVAEEMDRFFKSLEG